VENCDAVHEVVCDMLSCTDMEYLEGLNEAQKEAACTLEGPVLVLAGAGAGKTKTIAHRILHIVKCGTPMRRVLAITFTNKAAREMRERVMHLLEHYEVGAGSPPTVTTFHALCALLLREFSSQAGVSKHFTIADRADSLRMLKRILQATGNSDATEPRVILGHISRAKSHAHTCATYRARADAWRHELVANTWERYDAMLAHESMLDFDDLLVATRNLLTTHPTVCEHLQERWRYTHIDEYQDTNALQCDIARLLAGPRHNLFCVGDIDQNIYTFRGATIEHMLSFEDTFPHATVLRLEQNYRSTKTIVEVSNRIIAHNTHRKEKVCFTENPEGEKIELITAYDERHEAREVAMGIGTLLRENTPPHEIAVLYRANFQSRALEEACLAHHIPYRVLGTRFFDRAEVKSVLSYLRAALNPESESDIRRIINEPPRGIGKVTVEQLFGGGRERLGPAASSKVSAFYELLASIRDAALTRPAHEAIAYALERTGMLTAMQRDTEGVDRVENLQELVSLALTRYGNVPAPEGALRLIEDAALATDQDELDNRGRETGGAVALMTVHAAKGLEFAHVFITGLEDTLFPHESNGAEHAMDTEEERRLFYVALTRAKVRLHLSYAATRTVFGRTTARIPSTFLTEIDDTFFAQPRDERERVVYLD